jgi:hypothetical protein
MIIMMTSKAVRQTFLLILLGVSAFTFANAISEEKKNLQPADLTRQSFTFYTLSRGQGVPEPARQALEQLRRLFEELRMEKQVTRIEEERIGLEGETRLCAEFATAAVARQTWEQAQRLIADIELVNLEPEACSGK